MRTLYLTMAMLTLAQSLSAADKPIETSTRKVDFNSGDRDRGWASGKVLAVTKTSILIVPELEDRKPPTSFPFHDRLASGTFQKGRIGETSTYRVCDVEVGDLVSLGTFTENKQVYCVDIGIFERPGGLIPPSQVVLKQRPWYQCQNAQIAKRDKGTPIPEHLDRKRPLERYAGDRARDWASKVQLPAFFHPPERKIDFDIAERKTTTGKVLVVEHGYITITTDDKTPVRYEFHERVRWMAVQKKATPAFSYLKRDIKVGDIVELGWIANDDQIELRDPPHCVDVCIRERPGGSVPAPQIVDKDCPYHERRNAEIALRDKGTPIPASLDGEAYRRLRAQEWASKVRLPWPYQPPSRK